MSRAPGGLPHREPGTANSSNGPIGKAAQSAATTKLLIDTGRKAFSDTGFAATGTEDLVRAAGVTRGALYHHFADKTALFRAVLDAVQREVGDEVEASAARDEDPWRQLEAGCGAFLRAATDPTRQRIMLIDGPSVLGWDEWRSMDSQYSLQSLKGALRVLISQKIIVDQPVDPLAHLLSGAMNEAALWVARAPKPTKALDQAETALGFVLAGLKRSAAAEE